MCMADEKYTKETAYAFLEEIQRSFTSKFTEKEINGAIAYHLNNSFKNDLKAKLVLFILLRNILITIMMMIILLN